MNKIELSLYFNITYLIYKRIEFLTNNIFEKKKKKLN
jgi:hypothetical protein